MTTALTLTPDDEPVEEVEEESDLEVLRVVGESDDHWECFMYWLLDLQPGYRNKSKVAEHFGYKISTVREMAARYDWKGRNARWSNLVMSRYADRLADAKMVMADKMTVTAQKLLTKLEKRIDELSDSQTAMLGPKDTSILLDSVANVFKTLHGEKKVVEGDKAAGPTSIGVQINGPVQVNGGHKDDIRGRLEPYADIIRDLALLPERSNDPDVLEGEAEEL